MAKTTKKPTAHSPRADAAKVPVVHHVHHVEVFVHVIRDDDDDDDRDDCRPRRRRRRGYRRGSRCR